MSVKTLKLSDVAQLPQGQRYEKYAQFLRNRRTTNGEIVELNRRVAKYESVYEMSSAKMIERLKAGTLKETADIGRWLTLIELLARVRQTT
jgi:hypothetical protein